MRTKMSIRNETLPFIAARTGIIRRRRGAAENRGAAGCARRQTRQGGAREGSRRFLGGNLEGNAVDRDVVVFLPPSYAAETNRRYPVVYALHGYSIGAVQWSQEIHVPQTIEGAFAQGAQEMIVVLPDSKTLHNGSMYSSSVTTGDFENFIARDLVGYVDAHYRTIPKRTSREFSAGVPRPIRRESAPVPGDCN
jgi:Putative esterase